MTRRVATIGLRAIGKSNAPASFFRVAGANVRGVASMSGVRWLPGYAFLITSGGFQLMNRLTVNTPAFQMAYSDGTMIQSVQNPGGA